MGQMSLPLRPQVLPRESLLDEWEIRACRSWHQALRMQFNKARTRKNQEFWARAFGYTKGIWNRILNGDQYEETGDNSWKRHFPSDQLPRLLSETGHMGLIQWLIKDTPYKLVQKTAAEIDAANREEQLIRRQETLQAELEMVQQQLRGVA